MADLQLLDCCQPELGKLERVHYFPRQLLTADDMVADQDYFRQKLRRHNRFLHGWGVVCGLEVTADHTPNIPWRVKIDPGYALGPQGHEIYVADPVHIDLARCGPGAMTDPCDPNLLHTNRSGVGQGLFLAIKYAECLARPVRAMPAGCACEEEACEYSRIRDSFQIECLTELPPSHQDPTGPLLCDLINGKKLPPCPPCPADPWVVLAKVTLPASPSTNIVDENIDNFVRRQLYSTAVLQEQLIACCCKTADLVIEKTATVQENQEAIIYTIVVRNDGPSDAQNVMVTDTPFVNDREAFDMRIPNSFEPPDAWEILPTQPFVAKLGALEKDKEVTLRFGIKVGPQGTYRNIATVNADTSDPDASNNSVETVNVLPIVG